MAEIDAFKAAEGGNRKQIEDYLRLDPNRINLKGGWMNGSLLHYASEKGFIDICTFLIEEGALLDVLNNHGNTPLHLAARYGHTDLCRVLIQKNCPYDNFNFQDSRPLHLAAENGHIQVCELLLGLKANPNSRNKNGNTPLHLAAENGHNGVCELFTSRPIKIYLQNNNGNTALHLAADNGHVKVCEILVKLNQEVMPSTPEDPQSKNSSPLLRGSMKTLSLQRGISTLNSVKEQPLVINSKNKDGRTALNMAATEGYKRVCRLLIEHDAEVEASAFHQMARKLSIQDDDTSDGTWSNILERMFKKLFSQLETDMRDMDVFITVMARCDAETPKSTDHTIKRDNSVVSLFFSKFSEAELKTVFDERNKNAVETYFSEKIVELKKKGLKSSEGVEYLKKLKTKIFYEQREEIKQLLENRSAGEKHNLLELIAMDLDLTECVFKNVAESNIELESNSTFVRTVMKEKRTVSEVTKYKHVAFYVVLFDSTTQNSNNDKTAETLISKMVKTVTEEVIDLSKLHHNPLIFMLRLAAVMDQRSKKSPMLKADFLSIKTDLMTMVQEAMNINEMDDMKNTIPALVGTGQHVFAFLEQKGEGPLALALKYELDDFIALPQSKELIDMAWGDQSLVKALTPFSFQWDADLRTNRSFSISLYRRLPCLRALVVFLFRVGFLALTYYVLFQKDKSSLNYLLCTTILMVMVSGYFAEEIRQFITVPDYCSSFWNYLDILILVMYFLWVLPIWDNPSWRIYDPKDIMLSLTVFFLLFRLLNFASVFEATGVLVAMMIDMLKDVANFTLLYAFALLGFAVVFTVSFTSIDHFHSLSASLVNLFSFSLGTGLFELDIFDNDPLGVLGIGFALTYLIISSTVLMNLLTALFAVTLNIDEQERYKKSCCLFASFVREFYRPDDDDWLPEPFCVFNVAFKLCSWFSRSFQSELWAKRINSFLVVAPVDLCVTLAIVIPVCCSIEVYLMLLPHNWKSCCEFLLDDTRFLKQDLAARLAFRLAFWVGTVCFWLVFPVWFMFWGIGYLCSQKPNNEKFEDQFKIGIKTAVANVTYLVMVICIPVWFPVLFLFSAFQHTTTRTDINLQLSFKGYKSVRTDGLQDPLSASQQGDSVEGRDWKNKMTEVLEQQIAIYKKKTRTAQNAGMFKLEQKVDSLETELKHQFALLGKQFKSLEEKLQSSCSQKSDASMDSITRQVRFEEQARIEEKTEANTDTLKQFGVEEEKTS